MPKSFIKLARLYAIPVAIGLIAMIVAIRFMAPPPPKTVRLAAGAPGGAYYRTAEAYRDWLADYDVTVEILETAGSVENAALLADDTADIALIQAGIVVPEDAPDLRALGALFPEPLWIFVRADSGIEAFEDTRGARMAIGGEGSGTRALVDRLRAEWGGDWPEAASQPLSGNAARDALLAGDLDAVTFVAGVDAAYVRALLASPAVHLLPFENAPALSRRIPYLSETPLLAGVADIGARIPETDIPLVATAAMLVVDKDTHPAIQSLLLDAAHDLQRSGQLLAPPGIYPSRDLVDLPLSEEASRYYERGPSFLRRIFPFGVANFLERAWVLAIPLITLLIPLVRIAPPVYRWRIRRKIYVWYADLRALEAEGRAAKTEKALEDVRRRLEDIQAETGSIEVPLSYTDDLYRLRHHIEFVYDVLARLKPGVAA